MSFTPEAIGFTSPKDASHVMIFNLPTYIVETDVYSLCRRFGPIFRYNLIHKFRENVVKDEPMTSELIDPLEQDYVAPLPAPDVHLQGETEQTIAQAYAHVHFYSVNDANACQSALDGQYYDVTKLRVSHYRPNTTRVDERDFQLPTWKCLDLMNNMIGPTNWSCSIRWLRAYDVEQDSEIIAGQSETFATEQEMSAYQWAQQSKNFSFSYACEIEVLIPSLVEPKYDLHVACNGCSHARNTADRENCKKRAVTNAYRFLFAHLVLVRTSPTVVHVRSFEC